MVIDVSLPALSSSLAGVAGGVPAAAAGAWIAADATINAIATRASAFEQLFLDMRLPLSLSGQSELPPEVDLPDWKIERSVPERTRDKCPYVNVLS